MSKPAFAINSAPPAIAASILSPARKREALSFMARYSVGAFSRSSGDKLTFREDIARPSRSRTVREPITLTPRSRSLAIRVTTRSCWKSFSPKIAKSGRHWVNSLPTTVVTPPKKCGRKRSSRPAVAGPSVNIRVAKPSGYMVLTSGFQIRSTFCAASLATSAFEVGGYETKSSVGANWVGLTKIETITLLARRFASRTSDTWPSWSAPMVGTSAVVLSLALMLSRARRNAGTVQTIIGLRDIWTRSVWSRRRRPLTLRRGWRPYQSQRVVAKLSVDAQASGQARRAAARGCGESAALPRRVCDQSLRHTANVSNACLRISLDRGRA